METFKTNETKQSPQGDFRPRSIIVGLIIIAVGLVLIGRNTGWFDDQTSRIIISWPMLLIVIGFIKLFDKGRTGGIILMLVGLFFLLHNYFALPWVVGEIFWPVLIIIAGVAIILGASRIEKHHFFKQSAGNDDFLEDMAVFGGIERKILSQNFTGGKIVAIFGGSTIDLSHAVLAPGQNQLEIVALFGGCTLIVPSDWNVKAEVFSIFGGFADKRRIQQVDYNKILIIKGVTMFGGGEIKNFL
jgi:predicted membrane protein